MFVLLRQFCNVLSGVTGVIATVALIFGVGIDFANVVGRYVFNSALIWADEAMQFLMIGIAFFAACSVAWENRHIRMNVLLDRTGPAARRFFEIASDLATIGVSIFVAVMGWELVGKFIEFGQKSEAARIPMAIPQAVLPISFAIIALFVSVRLILSLLRPGDGKTSPDDAL